MIPFSTVRFRVMSQCILGLMEEWSSNRGTDVTTTRIEESEPSQGLERLRKIVDGESGSRDSEHETVAAVRSLLSRLNTFNDIDDLLTSHNLICQRLWSPLPPVLTYLFTSPSNALTTWRTPGGDIFNSL